MPHLPARLTAGVALTLLAPGAFAACGSGSSHASALGTQAQQSCTAVADVLSDGPDPGADPIGYAEAQVLPLRQLHIPEAGLKKAVARLASAYEAYSTHPHGAAGKANTKAVTGAEAAVNAICPQAAQ